MGQEAYPTVGTEPRTIRHQFRLLGTGASVPTAEVTHGGVTLTRPAIGRVLFTFAENPGVFVNVFDGLQAATPGDLKGYTLVWDTYDSTAKAIEVSIFDSADAAADLAANQYLHCEIIFKPSNV